MSDIVLGIVLFFGTMLGNFLRAKFPTFSIFGVLSGLIWQIPSTMWTVFIWTLLLKGYETAIWNTWVYIVFVIIDVLLRLRRRST